MATEKDKEVIYVGIKDPVEIRRSILESSKDAVQLLQRYEKFKEVRDEREMEVAKLKQLINNISRDIAKMKGLLPKTTLRFKEPDFEEDIREKAARMTGDSAKRKAKGKKGKKAKKAKKSKAVKKAVPKAEVKPVMSPKVVTELDKLEAELGQIESKLGKLV